jgi:hypothetical protein
MQHYGITLWSVGSVILAGVVLAVFTVRRRAKAAPPPSQPIVPVPTRESSELRESSEFWEPTEPDPRGRRKSFRRVGNPTFVQLIGLSDPPVRGLVMNRSSGGIGLAMDRPVAVGSVLLVLPVQAPAGTAPVEIRVLWCLERTDRHEIGCQFTAPLPTGLLMLFG